MKICRECHKGFEGQSYSDFLISGKRGRMCHDCYVEDVLARKARNEARKAEEAKRCPPVCSICYGVV